MAFGTPNTTIQASWDVLNVPKFCNMLQYCLKYETVWTQMPNQNTNFLFNLFSLLLIFNLTFSLSSHWFVSLQPMFSLSFFFRSASLTLKSTIRRPHRSSRRHRFSFEDSIAANLKTPSFYVSVWHSHHPLATLISPSLISPCWFRYAERQKPPKLATDHWPTLRRRGTPVWRTQWPKVILV